MIVRGRNGHVQQTGLRADPADHSHQHITFPMLGIVLSVYPSDNPLNGAAKAKHNFRGDHHEADVLIVNDGRNGMWILPGVVVGPSGATGADNYSEELPRPCSMMLNGAAYNSNLNDLDPAKLDGDWAVIMFIGGSINQPFMVSWYPHPANCHDPATSNAANKGYLVQGFRSFKRYQGLKATITDDGSFFLDTNESDSFLRPGAATTRVQKDTGGDVQIDVKATRTLEVNFNPPVAQPDAQPSLPQPNPPQGTSQRQDSATRMTLSDETIDLIAAKVATLLSRNDKVVISSPTEIDATAPQVNWGDGTLTAAINGVVLGGGTDPWTGATYYSLGSASSAVKAKK